MDDDTRQGLQADLRHEVLDRIYCAARAWQAAVAEHNSVAELPDDHPVRVAIERASDAMNDAYQAAGRWS